MYVLVGASLVTPDEDTPAGAQLYNVAGLALEQAPGDPLTWAEWLAAGASSRAATIGGPEGRRTDVRLAMYGLVPGGVYSVFWSTQDPGSVNPVCPIAERPLDAFKRDPLAPDLNSFVASSSGTGEFHGRVDHDLLAASFVYLSLVYHADGQTYYPLPNRGMFETQGAECRSSYGHDAMVHLSIAQKLS